MKKQEIVFEIKKELIICEGIIDSMEMALDTLGIEHYKAPVKTRVDMAFYQGRMSLLKEILSKIEPKQYNNDTF